jgi:hypothetical protein
MKTKILSFLFICLFAGSANAGLMLNIYENGSNDVVFDFSGSDTVTQGADTYARNGFWFGDIVENVYSGVATGYTAISDTFFAQNTTQGTSSTLQDIYLNGGVGHELGIRLDNTSILITASDGDGVSWSGQAILDLDFSDFLAGVWTGTSLNAGASDELILREGYTITIGATAVPAPGTLLLLALGLAGLGFAARNKAA